MGKAQAPPAEYLTGTGVAERVVTSRRLRAIALGAFLILSATPLGATPAPDGVLPNLGSNVTVQRLAAGGTAIVSPFVGAPVAAVELWYRAPSTGFGPKPVPSVARLAAQVVAASKPLVGESLGKVVNELGGRLTITVYSDSIAIAAIVPASGASSVVKAMTTSFFAPVVTDDGFGVAQRDVEQEALFGGFDPETVVRDAVFGDLFSEGPQHYPALGDPKDVSAIGIGDVRSFATRAFRAQNATLVISGVVDATIVASAVSGRSDGDAAPEAPSTPTLATGAPVPVSKPFVQPTAGYGWVGPAIADEREATAMDFIADYLFRSDDGYVAKAVAKTYPDAFLVGNFITLHDPGVMFVAYSGKDMSSLKTLVDDGFARVRKPLDARDFSVALAQFEYHIRSDLQTPTQVADNYGWYAVEGAADYAPGANGERGAYFTYANGLTPDFVASVAQKYLGTPPATITLSPTAAMKGEAQ
jgi:predicted Zn-dependent peptidase